MPNSKEETLYHALFMAQHLSKGDLKDGLVYILYELDVPSHQIGYHYVKTAILLFYSDPIRMFLKGIYQAVIEKVNPTATYEQLEQAMRSVIGQAYKQRDPQIWRYYFQPKNNRDKRPTNQEFISRIVNFMELWQACCKEVSYEV